MKKEEDTYKTIDRATSEILFKDRGSKFYGYAFPVNSEEDIKKRIEQLKKKHHAARHFCYAWFLGTSYDRYRANDDGEPANSAGMPILGQLQAYELTNVLLVVVRYFGGTKLGVGGLMQAYKQAAQMALESATIRERTIDEQFKLKFAYAEMNTVMRLIKEHDLRIESQIMALDCEFILSVRKKDSVRIFELFKNLYKVQIDQI